MQLVRERSSQREATLLTVSSPATHVARSKTDLGHKAHRLASTLSCVFIFAAAGLNRHDRLIHVAAAV
jgi:hypothetical protein